MGQEGLPVLPNNYNCISKLWLRLASLRGRFGPYDCLMGMGEERGLDGLIAGADEN